MMFAEQPLVPGDAEYPARAVRGELRVPGDLLLDERDDVLVGQPAVGQLGEHAVAGEQEPGGQPAAAEVAVVVDVVLGEHEGLAPGRHSDVPARGSMDVDERPALAPEVVQNAAELQ